MKSYVILEWDDHVPSLLDIISAQEHQITKIVCRQPSSVQLTPIHSSVTVESWNTFIPQPNESYLCGLSGIKAKLLNQQIQNNLGIRFDSLIHPRAIISPTAKIGSGSVISAGVIVASSVIIGEGCFIGQGVIFGHDTVLKDYVIVRSGAKLAGHVKVEENAVIGMGATLIENIIIGDNSVVTAGAVVFKNVPSQTIVSGVPAKPHS